MPASIRSRTGGLIHTYLGYDPQRFPLPAAEAPDLVTPAFDYMMAYGSLDDLTPEQLAEAVELDPSQIAGLGPSIASLIARLLERKRRILATYETQGVRALADRAYKRAAGRAQPPRNLQTAFARAVRNEQIVDFERMWYALDQRSEFARRLVGLMDHLGNKYQIEKLAAKYAFTGKQSMDVPRALEIKEELEAIDRLIEQLKEAAKNAKVYLIDLDELARFADQEQVEEMAQLQRQVEDLLRHLAEEQGLRRDGGRYTLTPKAFKLFQSKLLDEIFSELAAAKTGRHQVEITGDGAVEMQRTKPYEFGDSLANMDVVASVVNAMIRETSKRQDETSKRQNVKTSKQEDAETSKRRNVETLTGKDGDCRAKSRNRQTLDIRRGGRQPLTSASAEVKGQGQVAKSPNPSRRVRLLPEDIEIHATRNTPKCATVVCMDMSGSMRWNGQYINVKRMALALHGLIRTEYPGDFVDFVEICSLPQRRHISEVPELLPKPVTIHQSVVRLKADMSDPELTPFDVPPHFTNIQQGLAKARQLLQVQDTPNRQIILITDGLPTAHFEDHWLYLLYPPHPRTEHFTLREGGRCREQGITINIFLLSTWAQTEEDVQFAYRLAENTAGRVFFVGGRELDRFVVWDYLKRRRFIVG